MTPRLILAGALGLGVPWATAAQGLWRPEDRVVVRDFRQVVHLAASDAGVYVVTANGLAIYDPRFARWMPPVTALDGWPDRTPTAALGDPADASLWLGYDDGVVHYVPVLRLLEHIPVAGQVTDLTFDRHDPFRGVYARAGGAWVVIPRGGFVPLPASDLPAPDAQLRSPSVASVLRRFPAIEASAAFVLTDRRHRTRYADAVVHPHDGAAYLGTDGRGVVRYDPLVARFEPLPFGLGADGVGALWAGEEGIWVGSIAVGRGTGEAGFTWLTPDLQQTRYRPGPEEPAYRFAEVFDLTRWRDGIWAATDAGVVPVTREVSPLVDFPALRAYAVVTTEDGLWVGTERGLFLVAPDGRVRIRPPVGSGVVVALAAVGDTVWAGGADGVTRLGPGGFGVVPDAPHLGSRQPIVAMVPVGSRVVAATREGIVWRTPTGEWTVERPLPEIGAVTTVAAAPDGTVLVGGAAGVMRFDLDRHAALVIIPSADLPAPVRALAVNTRYLWVGTERGLVRFDRSAQ